jgi:hypothetical protein
VIQFDLRLAAMSSKMTSLPLGIAILLAVSFLSACSRSEETKSAKPAASPEPTPVTAAPLFTPLLAQSSPTPARGVSAGPPKPDEIKDAVSRVFEKAALPAASPNPAFVVGDFNGDGSEDLAVAVKPNEDSLGEINNELANWILEDPRKVVIPKTSAGRSAPPKPVRAEKGEILLAIIHGVGPQGWRNPQAKQTFLLKNAAASKLTFQSIRNLRESKDKQKLPPLRGDAIGETIEGANGLVYWTGAKYAWYSTAPD